MATAFALAFLLPAFVALIGTGIYAAAIMAGWLHRPFGNQRKSAKRIVLAGMAATLVSFIGLGYTLPPVTDRADDASPAASTPEPAPIAYAEKAEEPPPPKLVSEPPPPPSAAPEKSAAIPTSAASAKPLAKPPSTTDRDLIQKVVQHALGCKDWDYLKRVYGYLWQNDQRAFDKAIGLAVVDGSCTVFKVGEAVYIADTGVYSIKLRRQGKTAEYWTWRKTMEPPSKQTNAEPTPTEDNARGSSPLKAVVEACGDTPASEMTESQRGICNAFEHFKGVLERARQKTAPSPPGTMQIMRGSETTIERLPGR